MKIIDTENPDVKIIEPRVFSDDRGYFFESFRESFFKENFPEVKLVQENESYSKYGTLRGLHFQKNPAAQSKLVSVAKGKIIDVAVDLRKNSPDFLQAVKVELSGENKRRLFIPKGFAHGFIVVSEDAIVQYKVDEYYSPENDSGVRFDDPELNIDWGIDAARMIVSEKDANLPYLRNSYFF